MSPEVTECHFQLNGILMFSRFTVCQSVSFWKVQKPLSVKQIILCHKSNTYAYLKVSIGSLLLFHWDFFFQTQRMRLSMFISLVSFDNFIALCVVTHSQCRNKSFCHTHVNMTLTTCVTSTCISQPNGSPLKWRKIQFHQRRALEIM